MKSYIPKQPNSRENASKSSWKVAAAEAGTLLPVPGKRPRLRDRLRAADRVQEGQGIREWLEPGRGRRRPGDAARPGRGTP